MKTKNDTALVIIIIILVLAAAQKRKYRDLSPQHPTQQQRATRQQ